MPKLYSVNQFMDAAGEPLNAGLVYTYVAHSSTPKTTYTDSTGNTAHPNPVVLSAGGRAEIWLDTDMAYRIVIKDSNGNQIGSTIDDVVPVTTFAAVSGGTDIDVTGYSILTTAGDDIRINPNGSGKVEINGAWYLPNNAPASGEILTGSGGGITVWSSPSAVVLDSISNVNAPSPSNGDLLKYVSASSEWQNSPQSTLSVTASQVSDLASAAVAFTNKSGSNTQWTNDAGYMTSSSTNTITNKSGNISMWTNDSGYSTATAASQANMETATDNTVFATPGRLQNHPGVAKVWGYFTMNGTGPVLTVSAGYNIASTTSLGGSTFRIDFTTPFSSTNYCTILRYYGEESTATAVNIYAKATGSITLAFSSTVTGKNYDIVIFGDQ